MIDVEPDGVAPELIPVGETMKALAFPNEIFALLVGAIKELREQNDILSDEATSLRQEVWELKQLVCLDHPSAATCNE